MEKSDSSQLELFSQQQGDYAQSTQSGSRFSLFGYAKGYEKVILLIIAFITVGIISFSLGVEKGKRVAANITLPRQVVTTDVQQPIKPITTTAVVVPPVQQPVVQQKEILVKGYTVQIASYKFKDSAKKEAELLKKKGLSPIIISKGQYTVLCVGNFSDRKSAELFLTQITKNKRYQGSTIRRL